METALRIGDQAFTHHREDLELLGLIKRIDGGWSLAEQWMEILSIVTEDPHTPRKRIKLIPHTAHESIETCYFESLMLKDFATYFV
jgi:hypothetical protein